MVIPEIELGKVSMEMLLFAMVIDTVDAPLEDAEITFDGVGSDYRALLNSHIFFFLVIHFGVLAAYSHAVENGRSVGHEVGVLIDHFINERPKVLGSDFLHMIRPDKSATLDEGHDGCFVGSMDESVFWANPCLVSLRAYPELAADIGFVHFYNPAKGAFGSCSIAYRIR